jgi:hypothetical protein
MSIADIVLTLQRRQIGKLANRQDHDASESSFLSLSHHGSVSQQPSSSFVYISTATFTFDNNNLPLEKGNFCDGTRQVLCTRCGEYIAHKRDRHSTKSLHQHQKSKKCGLEFVGV